MSNKRMLTLLGLAFTLSLLAAACGPADSPPEDGALRVWVAWADDADQTQALFDRYRQAGGPPVKVTTGVDSAEISKALAGATPPDVVVLNGSDPVRAFYDQDLIVPLDPWIEATGLDLDDIYPAPLVQCEMPDGTHVCLPWGCDIDLLFWNKDLFKAAGLDPERPPQTMEELVEYADRLTLLDEEGKLVQAGFIPDFSRSHTDLYARMFGGSWINDEGTKLAANAQPMIDAANWQLQFYTKHGAGEVRDFVSSFDHYTNSSHPVSAGKRLSCQQCHPSSPRKRSPDQAFYAGKIAMMVEGDWLVGPDSIPHFQPELDYGVAPFPPPADHQERASTAVVQGAVALVPAGVKDKAAAAHLLAWMMQAEVLAGEMQAISRLPTSRTAARDPRFEQMPGFALFMDLVAHPNAKHAVTTPISPELNEALGQVEAEVLHKGGDPVRLLSEVQAEFAGKLEGVVAYHDRP